MNRQESIQFAINNGFTLDSEYDGYTAYTKKLRKCCVTLVIDSNGLINGDSIEECKAFLHDNEIR